MVQTNKAILGLFLVDIKAPICRRVSAKTYIVVLFEAARSWNQWLANIYGTSTPRNVSTEKNRLVRLQLTWESFQEHYEPKE